MELHALPQDHVSFKSAKVSIECRLYKRKVTPELPNGNAVQAIFADQQSQRLPSDENHKRRPSVENDHVHKP